jgi:hypothetical protein
MHCGRCGHNCLGGTCNAGRCTALQIATVGNAPLDEIAITPAAVFVGARTRLTTETGGIWRVPQAGGPAESYVTFHDVEAMAILADKLYFVVQDAPANGTSTFGGLWSCPLVGAAPCSPTLIAAADGSAAVVVDSDRVYYADDRSGMGLMVYAPPAAPTIHRADFGFSINYFVDGPLTFYTAVFSSGGSPQQARAYKIYPDAAVDQITFYENPNASAGRLRGTPDSIFFTAYDQSKTTGGVARRLPRNGGTGCDFGGADNKRPNGIAVDDTRVYWANQGIGAAEPFTGGSLATCTLTGCCTVPDVMWSGDGQPSAVNADARAVYFTTVANGGLWRIAKP